MELDHGTIVTGTCGRRWKAMQQVGEGACCSVYRAQLIGEDVQAALKVYKPGANYEAACQREALLLEIEKDHGTCKNLVQVLDQFQYKGQQCLIQEMLDLHLRQILHKNNHEGLSLWIIQRFAKDILQGLISLHRCGFVHADLKPGNLLWSPQEDCIKLIDFGLSFHQDDKDVWQVQSRGYRAPEVRWEPKDRPSSSSSSSSSSSGKSQSKLSTAIDMWSLGCILVEMFTGKKLFSSNRSNEQTPVCPNCKKSDSEERCWYQVDADGRVYPRECDGHLGGVAELLDDLTDLICRCIGCEASRRISAEVALQHPFFSHKIEPRYHDLLLLPTPVLRLLNMVDEEDLADEEEYEDIVADIKEECEKYGAVKKCIIPKDGPGKGKVYVEFEQSHHCEMAFQELCGRTYNCRTVITTYYPIEAFSNQDYF